MRSACFFSGCSRWGKLSWPLPAGKQLPGWLNWQPSLPNFSASRVPRLPPLFCVLFYLCFAPSATPLSCQFCFKWCPSRSSMAILPLLIILSIFLFLCERGNSKIPEIRIMRGHYSVCSTVHTLSWAEMLGATIWHSVYINIIKIVCHISWFYFCFVLHSRLVLSLNGKLVTKKMSLFILPRFLKIFFPHLTFNRCRWRRTFEKQAQCSYFFSIKPGVCYLTVWPKQD